MLGSVSMTIQWYSRVWKQLKNSYDNFLFWLWNIWAFSFFSFYVMWKSWFEENILQNCFVGVPCPIREWILWCRCPAKLETWSQLWTALSHGVAICTHILLKLSQGWWVVSTLIMSLTLETPFSCYLILYIPFTCHFPKGRPGMYIVIALSGISGLSFDSSFLSPLLFFLPSPLTLSVFIFC